MTQRGRKKKHPDYNQDAEINSVIQQAVGLYSERPIIQYVSETMSISRLKARKLLITAGVYSTEESKRVQELYDNGHSIQEIKDITGFSKQTINSFLPYSKSVYKLNNPPQTAENTRICRKRRKASKSLIEHPDDMDYLWDALQAFEKYPFKKNERFAYSLMNGKLVINGRRYTKKEVEKAYRLVLAGQSAGTDELVTIFNRMMEREPSHPHHT